MDSLHAGPQPWTLTPEGALVELHHGVAVMADIHLGYEWARAKSGDVVPAHSLVETKAILARLLMRAEVHRLIVAGDLVESWRPCPRTARDVDDLRRWLKRYHCQLELVRGNHDPRVANQLILGDQTSHQGWTIAHGHRHIEFQRAVIGHLHPALNLEGRNYPCYLISEDLLILPAISANAAGVDVLTTGLPDFWSGNRQFHCIVTTSTDLLDFGQLDQLRARLGLQSKPDLCKRRRGRRLVRPRSTIQRSTALDPALNV